MYFKRKVYHKLLEWKNTYANRYAVMLEGPRRVGKSTIAEAFAKNEYKTYIMLDFSRVSESIKALFDDISDLDLFFLRLQAETGVSLIENNSLIVFDEVQLFPKAREAIKHLVRDGRFHYIETGSLISIKKNVKDILIPSEEMKVDVYPMDLEEFYQATGVSYSILGEVAHSGKPVGQAANRSLMKNLRLYMAVGGMPQAVEAFVLGKNFAHIDEVKRQIIHLYEEDFRRLDSSGRLSAMYASIPSQLAKGKRRYVASAAISRASASKTDELLYDLIDSKTVIPCYNTTDPGPSLSSTKDLSSFKLYLADTGLFVTQMFMDRPNTENEIYVKLLSDKLSANLGYLYENLVAQMIASTGRELYYHTWEKAGSTHYYEVDFLTTTGGGINVFEAKSSGMGKHESLQVFRNKYSNHVRHSYILSQKDSRNDGELFLRPFYLLPFLV